MTQKEKTPGSRGPAEGCLSPKGDACLRRCGSEVKLSNDMVTPLSLTWLRGDFGWAAVGGISPSSLRPPPAYAARPKEQD